MLHPQAFWGLSLVAPSAMGSIAQVPSSSSIPFLDYINLGVVGFLIIAIIKGWFVTGREKDEIKDNRDFEVTQRKEAEAKFHDLLEKVHNDILPQLFETTQTLGEAANTLSELNKIIDDIKEIMS